MKLNATVVFFFLCIIVSFSQTKKPEFEFTLYGEDSRGHRDSVIIGYAHDARSDEYLDTAYGDKNISNIKFDSIFEMRVHKITYLRATNPSNYNNFGVSKRVTLYYSNEGSSTCLPYGLSIHGFVLMKVKYPPFKLFWDRKQFERAFANRCVGLSYLIYSEYLTQDFPPEARKETIWLGKDSALMDSLRVLPMYPDTVKPGINYTGLNIPINYADGRKDTLQANYLFGFKSSTLAPTENLVQTINKVYPNPCREQLNLFLPDIKKVAFTVNIYSINGELLEVEYKYSDNTISVETSSLNSGNYIIEVVSKDGQRFIAKFNKVK